MSKVNIVKAHTYELKPDSKYLIVLDNAAFSQHEAHQLLGQLREMGAPNALGMLVHGDPNKAVKIIEQETIE